MVNQCSSSSSSSSSSFVCSHRDLTIEKQNVLTKEVIETVVNNKVAAFRDSLLLLLAIANTPSVKRVRSGSSKFDGLHSKLNEMTSEIFNDLGLSNNRVSYDPSFDIGPKYAPFKHSVAAVGIIGSRIGGSWLPYQNVVAMNGVWSTIGSSNLLAFIVEQKVSFVIRLADNSQLQGNVCGLHPWIPKDASPSEPREILREDDNVGITIKRLTSRFAFWAPVDCAEFYVDNWVDGGALKVDTLIALVNRVRVELSRAENKDRPFIVHCYAGYGRTGTFIVAKQIMDEIDAGRDPDIIQMILLGRCYRGELFVSTSEQLGALFKLKEVYKIMNLQASSEQLSLVAEMA